MCTPPPLFFNKSKPEFDNLCVIHSGFYFVLKMLTRRGLVAFSAGTNQISIYKLESVKRNTRVFHFFEGKLRFYCHRYLKERFCIQKVNMWYCFIHDMRALIMSAQSSCLYAFSRSTRISSKSLC